MPVEMNSSRHHAAANKGMGAGFVLNPAKLTALFHFFTY
jgi:hypothetical protein